VVIPAGGTEQNGDDKANAAKQAKELSEAAKAAADARTAEASAAKSEKELEERNSPAAKAQREAESQKATAEAQQGTAAAKQGELTAMLPDLSKVDRGSLELKGDQPLFSSELSQRALAAATSSIAQKVKAALKGAAAPRILVTGDAALATSDSVYQDVMTGLEELTSAAAKLVEQTDSPPEEMASMFALPAAAVAGLASALPGALSLLSAHRTVTTAAATVEGIAATAATAGSLKGLAPAPVVVHDDIRLLPDGVVVAKLASLDEQRRLLLGRKVDLEEEKAGIGATDPGADAKVKALTARIGLIDTVLTAIETFTVSLRTTAEGATRSPLATAALREQLHPASAEKAAEKGKFTHALFVQAAPGSTQQVISDRPLWWNDKYSAVGVISVAYILIEVVHSEVVIAGSASGKATVTGSIGKSLKVEAETLGDPAPTS
jgi:hypothetical protein